MSGWIKICGITTVDDALAVVESGADAVGINLWPQSPRSLTLDDACAIADAVRTKIEIVAVVVNESEDTLRAVLRSMAPHRLQLHGDETAGMLKHLQPLAFKALGVARPEDVDIAERFPGDIVLVDAHDREQRGGTGKTAPWDLAAEIAGRRRTVLAGGLHPDNVAEAIARVRPWGVDTASGVEISPGKKDRAKITRFVENARAAFASLATGGN